MLGNLWATSAQENIALPDSTANTSSLPLPLPLPLPFPLPLPLTLTLETYHFDLALI